LGFRCLHCEETFENVDQMMRHLDQVHKIPSYKAKLGTDYRQLTEQEWREAYMAKTGEKVREVFEEEERAGKPIEHEPPGVVRLRKLLGMERKPGDTGPPGQPVAGKVGLSRKKFASMLDAAIIDESKAATMYRKMRDVLREIPGLFNRYEIEAKLTEIFSEEDTHFVELNKIREQLIKLPEFQALL